MLKECTIVAALLGAAVATPGAVSAQRSAQRVADVDHRAVSALIDEPVDFVRRDRLTDRVRDRRARDRVSDRVTDRPLRERVSDRPVRGGVDRPGSRHLRTKQTRINAARTKATRIEAARIKAARIRADRNRRPGR